MKIFIIFLGLLLVNISIFTYKADYSRYTSLCRALDNIAFESAELLTFTGDEEEAQRHADQLLNYTIKDLKNIKVKNSVCIVSYKNEDEIATAFISIDVEKLFRFPHSQVTNIKAEARLQFTP
jgi:hypothetical protein